MNFFFCLSHLINLDICTIKKNKVRKLETQSEKMGDNFMLFTLYWHNILVVPRTSEIRGVVDISNE